MLKPLLQILMLSQEFKLGDLVSNMMEFNAMIDSNTPDISKFLASSTFQNQLHLDFAPIKWNPKQ